MCIGTADQGRKIRIRNYGGPDIDGTTAAQTNQWYHAVIIDDGTNMKIYLNGTLETSQTRLNTSKNT